MARVPSALAALSLLALSAAAGCGGAAASDDFGTGHAERAPEPVELALRTPAGTFLDVSELRGKPVVLFLFATFDALSQAATQPLSRFARAHAEDAHVLGIAVQPNAAELAGPWADALGLTLTVSYEPEPRILAGTSELGTVVSVPSYVVLDARGVIVARYTGFASENKLERLLDAAR
jgi:peroxiredoxin